MKTFHYSDSSEIAMAHILRRILYLIPPINICLALVLFYTQDPFKAKVILSTIPLFLSLLILVRIGYLKTALNILLVAINLIVTWSCINGNGINDIGIILYPISVLIASLMFSRQNLFYFVSLTVTCLVIIVLGDLFKLYTPYAVYTGRWPDVIIIGSLLFLGLTITSSHANKLKEAINDRILEGERQIQLGIQIEHSLEEKQQLFREVHHRVKNHLSFINSLIDMESMSHPDLDFKKNRELKSRVVAIARVHDQLYHTDNFDFVKTKAYLEGLISQFSMTYTIAEIPINLKIDDFSMEVRKIIFLGISLHEITSLLGEFSNDIQQIEFILTKEDGSIQLSVLIEHQSRIEISTQVEKIELLQFLSQKLEGKLDIIEGQERSFIEIEF